MKPRILIQALFHALILTTISTVFGDPSAPGVEDSISVESTANTPPIDEAANRIEEKTEALRAFIKTEVDNAGLENGRKMQLRSMALAAYRENHFEPLWPDLFPPTDDAAEVIAESTTKVEGDAIPNLVVAGEVGPAAAAFRSFGSLLSLHGFEETLLNFNLKPGVSKPADCPVPLNDLIVTLGLAEVCLRLKQGPDSVAEWPNWTFGDHPLPKSTKAHYDEVTARFGTTAAGAPDPLEVAEAFLPKNWVYQRLHGAIREIDEAPEPPQIEIDGLVKVGNEFSQARELADFLFREGILPEDNLEGIEGIYTEPLSEAIRSFQKKLGLQSDGILGPSTVRSITNKGEDDKERLFINLHRARRLPDSMGERYLLANLPSAEVHAFEDGSEAIRMRVVFGKHRAGQHTPIFRDQMENVVFRPYWNVPYSIAISEGPYSDLSYLGSNGFKIISSSSGRELPLTVASLEMVRSRAAFVRQDGGTSNALGLVKFLFPNKHAVYFHDTPFKHYFKNTYRAQSHGCVRLEQPEAMANWVLKDSPDWNPDKINYAIYKGSRNAIDLENPIPVYIVYFTAFPDPKEESGVDFYRDCYDYDKPGAVVDPPGPKLEPADLPEPEERRWNPFSKFKRSNGNSNGSSRPSRPSRPSANRKGGFFERLKGMQN